jgi:hypothetical protein
MTLKGTANRSEQGIAASALRATLFGRVVTSLTELREYGTYVPATL